MLKVGKIGSWKKNCPERNKLQIKNQQNLPVNVT